MSEQQSYSNALIKFVLVHYVDILYGKITPEEMGDFTKSAGRKNPQETALIWKADIDQAIISLSKRHHGWADALAGEKVIEVNGLKFRGMSDSMILHLCRSNSLSNMQRDIVNSCIMKDCIKACKDTGSRGSKICWNEGIISRMRRFLNKQYLAAHGKDDHGRFVEKVMERLKGVEFVR